MTIEEAPPVEHAIDPGEAQIRAEGILKQMRKIAAAQERIEADRRAQVDEIEQWARDQQEHYAHEKAVLELNLAPLIRVLVEHDPHNRKSILLAQGEAGFRSMPGRTEVEDAAALLGWLEANRPELVRVKREPKIDQMKQTMRVHGEHFIDTEGEIVPGVRYVSGDADRFFVKPR